MDITWYGQACFKVKGKNASLIFDPFSPGYVGLRLPKLSADAVVVSHNHQDHNYTEGVIGSDSDGSQYEPVVIAGPGEYEVKGITIVGIKTFHDKANGEERGKNTVYQATIDGVSIVHLGDLGHVLTKEQVAQIGVCDILMVPVGSVYTIDAAEAAENMTLLEPSIILPMHYKVPGLKFELDPAEKFLKEVGKEDAVAQPKLTITKEKLPDEPQVVVLEKQ